MERRSALFRLKEVRKVRALAERSVVASSRRSGPLLLSLCGVCLYFPLPRYFGGEMKLATTEVLNAPVQESGTLCCRAFVSKGPIRAEIVIQFPELFDPALSHS